MVVDLPLHILNLLFKYYTLFAGYILYKQLIFCFASLTSIFYCINLYYNKNSIQRHCYNLHQIITGPFPRNNSMALNYKWVPLNCNDS